MRFRVLSGRGAGRRRFASAAGLPRGSSQHERPGRSTAHTRPDHLRRVFRVGLQRRLKREIYGTEGGGAEGECLTKKPFGGRP